MFQIDNSYVQSSVLSLGPEGQEEHWLRFKQILRVSLLKIIRSWGTEGTLFKNQDQEL